MVPRPLSTISTRAGGRKRLPPVGISSLTFSGWALWWRSAGTRRDACTGVLITILPAFVFACASSTEGYVGLATAAVYANLDHRVICADTSEATPA